MRTIPLKTEKSAEESAKSQMPIHKCKRIPDDLARQIDSMPSSERKNYHIVSENGSPHLKRIAGNGGVETVIMEEGFFRNAVQSHEAYAREEILKNTAGFFSSINSQLPAADGATSAKWNYKQ